MYNGRYTLDYEDRLVSRWRSTDGKHRYFFRGKRVKASCPLTAEERKEYVKNGSVKAVAMIKVRTGLSLHDSLDLLRKAQGQARRGRS
jgi:hypothetical protein